MRAFRVPPRWAPSLFALILSGVMSLVVSGGATLRALGPVQGLVGIWLSSWAITFPTALVIAPRVRELVAALTAEGR